MASSAERAVACLNGMAGYSARSFLKWNQNLHNIEKLDGKSYVMRGPMRIGDTRHTPVRGDLADIRLAGRYFVPHYAVPQPRLIGAGGALLMAASRIDAETIEALASGAAFGVLDIAGEWAWGQANGEGGPVGYVALDCLESLP